jgi:hypothetical protein
MLSTDSSVHNDGIYDVDETCLLHLNKKGRLIRRSVISGELKPEKDAFFGNILTAVLLAKILKD